jgi:hypothetical protein
LLALGTGRAMATNPTDTIVNGQVVNSTFSFTNITDSGTTATLNQTTIPNLTDGVPFTSLQLVLTSITYTDTQDTFVGKGSAPTITFDLTPTLQMMNGGNYGPQQVQRHLHAAKPGRFPARRRDEPAKSGRGHGHIP